MKKFNLILLSAGESSRMGSPKAYLRFNENFTFIEQIISVYQKVENLNAIFVVLNSKILDIYKQHKYTFLKNTHIILNDKPEKDRFHSIYLATNFEGKTLASFIQNIDNPFITEKDIHQIFSKNKENSYVVANVSQKNTHPILISKSIITKLSESANFKGSLRDFLRKYEKEKAILSNKKLLYNINTPDDYKLAIL